ncbi:unnamed protein product [Brassicogethes aeneus]|uniref:Uncharacterized protein n=1 Tax=Brassicogethes aeneus TaxID=1431903 RepID=A0A9P0APG7_BRAAE|nr:unnamed protein product [Brassicogethes aeneus]
MGNSKSSNMVVNSEKNCDKVENDEDLSAVNSGNDIENTSVIVIGDILETVDNSDTTENIEDINVISKAISEIDIKNTGSGNIGEAILESESLKSIIVEDNIENIDRSVVNIGEDLPGTKSINTRHKSCKESGKTFRGKPGERRNSIYSEMQNLIMENVLYRSPLCCCTYRARNQHLKRNFCEKLCLFRPTLSNDEVTVFLLVKNHELSNGITENKNKSLKDYDFVTIKTVLDEVEYKSPCCGCKLTSEKLKNCFWRLISNLCCFNPLVMRKIHAFFDVKKFIGKNKKPTA